MKKIISLLLALCLLTVLSTVACAATVSERLDNVERELAISNGDQPVNVRIAQVEAALGIHAGDDQSIAERLAELEHELGLDGGAATDTTINNVAAPAATLRPDYLPLPNWADKRLTVQIPKKIIYPLTWKEAQSGQYTTKHQNTGSFGSSSTLSLGNDRYSDVVWTLNLMYSGSGSSAGLCDSALMEVRTGSVNYDPGYKIECKYAIENHEFKKLESISVMEEPWSAVVFYDAQGEIKNCYISYYDGKFLSDKYEVRYEKKGSTWEIHDSRADRSNAIKIDADGMLQMVLSMVDVVHTDETLVLWQEESVPAVVRAETVPLEDLDSFSNDNVAVAFIEEYGTDSYGNDHISMLRPYIDEGAIEYLLNGEYRKLRATVYIPRASMNAMTESELGRVKLTLYGDDKPLYTLPKLRLKDEPIDISVDLTGVKFLRIAFENDCISMKTLVVLGDAVLVK